MIASKLVALATFVSKIEENDIHVIDASISDNILGARVAVRGGLPSLVSISNLVDEVTDPISRTGMVVNPLLSMAVSIDGLGVRVIAINVKGS